MSFRKRYEEFFEQLDKGFWDEDRFVPGIGPEDAEVVLVGEAPGENEVKQGEPFVGRAGSRLEDALEELGVERSELYITNLMKIRPPENRDPKNDEIEAWRPLLIEEIESIDPDAVVALGTFASQELTGSSGRITDIHGKKFDFEGYEIYPVFHPAATLYDRSKWPEFVEDLEKAVGERSTGQKTLRDL